jgi:hypothetical protein
LIARPDPILLIARPDPILSLSEVGSCLSDPACPARVSCVGCVLPSGPSPCGWLSQPPTTMPDKTPRWHPADARLPGNSMRDDSTRAHAVSGLFTRSCPSPTGFIVLLPPGAFGASRVLERLSSCMPRPEDSGGPPHPSHNGCFVLPSRTLRLSASATSLFRSCTSTSGSAISPAAYRILCVRLPHNLVRGLPRSAMGPTLDTGGWLTLTRRGLSPRKRRQALLGAITCSLSGAETASEACWRSVPLEAYVGRSRFAE